LTRVSVADRNSSASKTRIDRWDAGLISRGLWHLQKSGSGDRLTAYHVEAEIAACHVTANRFEDTNWRRIATLYDYLFVTKPTPVVALNRAIALSRVDGPRAGLTALAPLTDDATLSRYYLFHAALGQLNLEVGDAPAAVRHFRAALTCECSQPERRFLERLLTASEKTSQATV